MKYLPELVQLAAGLPVMGLLVYLAGAAEGPVALLAIVGLVVVFTGWQKVLITLGWRLAGKDPDDFDFHFPG